MRTTGTALAAMAALLAMGDARARTDDGCLLIRNATLIDGTGAAPRRGVDIEMSDGRITRIARAIRPAPGEAVIDGTNRFVIPGLIDSHVHLDFGISSQLTAEEKAAVVRNTPRAFLFNGVTTVLNLSSPIDWILPLREAQRRGETLGPRIFSTGSAFTPVNGWGSRHTDAIPDVDYAAKRARDYAARGVDGIKIILDNGLGDSHTFTAMSEEELRKIVEIAGQNQLPVYIHAINLAEYRRAAAVTPRAIVHGLQEPVEEAFIADLAARHIAVVPTISLFESFLRADPEAGSKLDSPILRGSMPAFLLEKMRTPSYYPTERAAFIKASRTDSYAWAEHALPVFCANIGKMHRAGVKIGVGTDAGGTIGYDFQGYNTPWEMQLLVKCGLSPMEALVAATRSNAEIIGAQDRLGTVEVGKAGDVLVLTADPTANIANVRRIEWVVQGGVAHPRSDLAYRP
ncbi:MAG: amidohydrolase family protein [Sphingobium sp.]